MTDEFSRAVSITNSYFTLVDGLTSGLEDCLSEDVILDWFGRTVKRRANVNTFMNVHKINSRHVFSNIVPTESISYEKHNLNRKLTSQLNKLEKIKNPNNLNENVDDSLQATDTDGNHLKEEGVSYQICDSDLDEITHLEIAPTIVEEIEKNIELMEKMKVEEAAESKIKRDFSQDSGSEKMIQAKRFKFIEATGEIHLWKERKSDEDAYNTYPTSIHIWRRPCKLLIAYSLIKSKSFSNSKNINMDHKPKSTVSELQRRKLPNFEMCELSCHLIPNINHFGGYLRQENFLEDRDNFLKSLNDEIARKNSSIPQYVPQYVGNKLVLHKTNLKECEQSKDFAFNYQIHMIIYKDDKQCKLNHSQKFAEMK